MKCNYFVLSQYPKICCKMYLIYKIRIKFEKKMFYQTKFSKLKAHFHINRLNISYKIIMKKSFIEKSSELQNITNNLLNRLLDCWICSWLGFSGFSCFCTTLERNHKLLIYIQTIVKYSLIFCGKYWKISLINRFYQFN